MEYRICKRCIMDTSDPEIHFDENGYCNHCSHSIAVLNGEPFSLAHDEKRRRLKLIADEIKEKQKSQKYDVLIGLSGGVDSSYVALMVKELGLRALAVHLDNGWNTEISVANINNICTILGIDLFTYVIDWDEFKDLQLSFLKASTPDSEIPTDHAIVAILFRIAREFKIGYIFAGNNVTSESILPRSWADGHFDWEYIKDVQRRFGSKRLKTFPHRNFVQFYYDRRKVNWISVLNFIDYDKEKAKIEIAEKIGWKDYGRKHGESNYTRVLQEYILPRKFGFDKRRAHYSSLIASNQMTRDEALEKMKEPFFESEDAARHDIDFVSKNLISASMISWTS